MNSKGIKTPFYNKRGFTIVELMITVGVFGVLLAVAVPNFLAEMPARQLNGAARQVLAELMWARAKAVEENNQFVVSSASNTSFTVLDDDNNNGNTDAGEWTRTRNIQDEFPDVTLSGGISGPDPTFSPRGTTSGTSTITLTNPSGSKTVTVNLTGSVRIN